MARRLIDLASERARARGLRKLTLETRIELVENHATFERLGFEKTGLGAHDGYDTPTFVRMEKSL